jgi:hypothetical protein
MTHSLAQAQTQWQQQAWQALAEIDLAALEPQAQRAELALCAAVGLAKTGRSSRALQAVKQALAWGVDREGLAYLASRGGLGGISRALRRANDPRRQSTVDVLKRSLVVPGTGVGGAPATRLSEVELARQFGLIIQRQAKDSNQARKAAPIPPTPDVATKTPADYRSSPRFSAEAYTAYQSLSQGEQASKIVLIDAKSLPRSGLHYLKNSLERLLPGHFSFCEWYQEPGCCKRMPCALTAYAQAAQEEDRVKVRLLKSHDFELDDPAYPTLPILHRLVLIRDPLFILTSWFELHQMQQHKDLLQAHGISMAKIYLLHESEVTRMALRLMDAAYQPLGVEALRKWLDDRRRYISGFLRRWALPVSAQRP